MPISLNVYMDKADNFKRTSKKTELNSSDTEILFLNLRQIIYLFIIIFRRCSLYLGSEDVLDLSVFSGGVWRRDVGVAAAADSGFEKHRADRGRCGPTHGVVTALCGCYTP